MFICLKKLLSTEIKRPDSPTSGFEDDVFLDEESPWQRTRPQPKYNRSRHSSFFCNDGIRPDIVRDISEALLSPKHKTIIITHKPNETHGYVAKEEETCIGILQLKEAYPPSVKPRADLYSMAIGQNAPTSSPYKQAHLHWSRNQSDPSELTCNINELTNAVSNCIQNSQKTGEPLTNSFKARCNELGNLIIKMHLNVAYADFLVDLQSHTGFQVRTRSNTVEKERMKQLQTRHRTRRSQEGNLVPASAEKIREISREMANDPPQFTQPEKLPPSDLYNLFRVCREQPAQKLFDFLIDYGAKNITTEQHQTNNIPVQHFLVKDGPGLKTSKLISGSAFLRQQLSQAIMSNADFLGDFNHTFASSCASVEDIQQVLLGLSQDPKQSRQLQSFFTKFCHVNDPTLATAIYLAVLKQQAHVMTREVNPLESLYLDFCDQSFCNITLMGRDNLLDDDHMRQFEPADSPPHNPLSEFTFEHFKHFTQLAVFTNLNKDLLDRDLARLKTSTQVFTEESVESDQFLARFSDFICHPESKHKLFGCAAGIAQANQLLMNLLSAPPTFLEVEINHQTAIDIERWIPSLVNHRSSFDRETKLSHHLAQVSSLVEEDLDPETIKPQLPNEVSSPADWEAFLAWIQIAAPKTAAFCRRMNQSQSNFITGIMLAHFTDQFAQLSETGTIDGFVMVTLDSKSRKISISQDPDTDVITVVNTYKFEVGLPVGTMGDLEQVELGRCEFTTRYTPTPTGAAPAEGAPGEHLTRPEFELDFEFDPTTLEKLFPAPKKSRIMSLIKVEAKGKSKFKNETSKLVSITS